MTSDATVVARYDAAKRAADEQTLRRVVRTQGMLLLILGVLLLFGTLLGFIMLVVFVGVAIDDAGVAAVYVLFVFVMLVVPVGIAVLGVRQLRRRPHVPEVAVTITPAAVLFPAIDRPSALAPRIPAEEWTREETSAEIVPASGLQAARVDFTWQDGGKRRRRSIAASNLDVDARVIVDALRGSHTS